MPKFWPTAKQGYIFLIPLIMLLFCMIVLTYSAEKSAIYAIITLIIVSWFSRKKELRVDFGRLVQGADGAMRGLVSVAIACAGCGIIIGALSLSLLSYKLTFQLMSMVGGTLLPVLCLAAIICYIMGMGVSPLVSYLTLALDGSTRCNKNGCATSGNTPLYHVLGHYRLHNTAFRSCRFCCCWYCQVQLMACRVAGNAPGYRRLFGALRLCV